MKRDELIKNWKVHEREILKTYREQFTEQLIQKANELRNVIYQSFEKLSEELKGKEDIEYFLFSPLKVDILQRNYTVLLEAQDYRWYLDNQICGVTFQVDFLFEPLNQLWDYLLVESKKYVGKINTYDVREVIFQEFSIYSSSIVYLLRYLLRDIEKAESFQGIHKLNSWVIRWGEYRDDTEMIVQIDREQKSQKQWKSELFKAKKDSTLLVYSYWFKGEFSDSDCSKKDLQFITFENSKLKNIQYNDSIMIGASFINTKLTNCNFKGCNLQDARFLGSYFIDVDFTDANITNAVFPEAALPYLHLTPEQLQVILVEKEG